jgi:hypothetical protein
MTKEGFRIDKKKRMSRRAVCAYFGERGMPVSPAEVAFHAVGTYTSRKWDHEHGGRSTDELETIPALAVIIKERPKGICDWGDTDDGRMDVYALSDIYGECQDDVPAPKYALAAAKKASRPAKRKAAR